MKSGSKLVLGGKADKWTGLGWAGQLKLEEEWGVVQGSSRGWATPGVGVALQSANRGHAKAKPGDL